MPDVEFGNVICNGSKYTVPLPVVRAVNSLKNRVDSVSADVSERVEIIDDDENLVTDARVRYSHKKRSGDDYFKLKFPDKSEVVIFITRGGRTGKFYIDLSSFNKKIKSEDMLSVDRLEDKLLAGGVEHSTVNKIMRKVNHIIKTRKDSDEEEVMRHGEVDSDDEDFLADSFKVIKQVAKSTTGNSKGYMVFFEKDKKGFMLEVKLTNNKVWSAKLVTEGFTKTFNNMDQVSQTLTKKYGFTFSQFKKLARMLASKFEKGDSNYINFDSEEEKAKPDVEDNEEDKPEVDSKFVKVDPKATQKRIQSLNLVGRLCLNGRHKKNGTLLSLFYLIVLWGIKSFGVIGQNTIEVIGLKKGKEYFSV